MPDFTWSSASLILAVECALGARPVMLPSCEIMQADRLAALLREKLTSELLHRRAFVGRLKRCLREL